MSLGILCPGQGDQSPAMFNVLAANDPHLAGLTRHLGRDPRTLSTAQLTVNAVAQPVICMTQLALWLALRDRLPDPRVFAGYSVGEVAAYGCAGAIGAEDLVALAALRAHAMDAACADASGLLAVRGLWRAELARLCGDFGLEIAIVNGPDRCVVGGRRKDLAAISPTLEERGAKLTPLAVAVASHTSLLTCAVPPFAEALSGCLNAFATPVLAGINGSPIRTVQRAVATLSAQVAQTVEWVACLDGLAEMGCTTLLELGPGNALSRLVRDHLPGMTVRSVSEFHSLDGVVEWVERVG